MLLPLDRIADRSLLQAAPAAAAKKDDSSSDSDSSDSSDDEDEKMKEDAPASKKRAAEESEAPAKKAKVEEAATDGASTTVFVGQLSWNVDNDWLQSEFAECGEVVSARVVTDRESGRSRGFGYVEFTTAEAAQKAMELAGKEVDGRAIKVDVSTPRAPRDAAERPKKVFVRPLPSLSYLSFSTDSFFPFLQNDELSGPPTTTLFVGNLPFSASEDAVWTAFADYGDVSSVRLPTDPESGRPKGFGYVEFASLEAATSAVTAGGPASSGAGVEIDGRRLRLDYSQPRADRQGGGDRGGRGGGYVLLLSLTFIVSELTFSLPFFADVVAVVDPSVEDAVEDVVASATVTVDAVEDVAVAAEPVVEDVVELAVEETVDGDPATAATPATVPLLSSRARRCRSTKPLAITLLSSSLAFSASPKRPHLTLLESLPPLPPSPFSTLTHHVPTCFF